MSTRRFLAPEVVQTSAMDCGPASLKCLLEGFGIPVSYGRLREACQTDVDGTSIDTMEQAASQLGLDAEQVMLPVDHLLHRGSNALPALVVTQNPNGTTHFVVVWRRHGRFVQVMDPATGRRWPGRAEFLHDLYVHSAEIPAPEWRAWAGSEGFLIILRGRLADLEIAERAVSRWIAAALSDESWRSLAALDATTRMVASMVRSGGLLRRKQAADVIEALFERARRETKTEVIPEPYWLVRPSPHGPGEPLRMRGAVLISVAGRRKAGGGRPSRPTAALAGVGGGTSGRAESSGTRSAPISARGWIIDAGRSWSGTLPCGRRRHPGSAVVPGAVRSRQQARRGPRALGRAGRAPLIQRDAPLFGAAAGRDPLALRAAARSAAAALFSREDPASR